MGNRFENLLRRFASKKPKEVKRPREQDIPSVVFLASGKAEKMMMDRAKESGEEPYKLVSFEAGNRYDLEPGLYCETKFTVEEWNRRDIITDATISMVSQKLATEGIIQDDQIIRMTPTQYMTREGHVVAKIEVLA